MYRLLIADDEALEREGLELIITRAMPDRFEMIHAPNGRRAIELAERHRPDIVMMDVKMPGIQGLEALQDIQAIHSRVKMVLVTAYDHFAYAKQAIALGVKDYIVKPAKKEQIIGILQRLVQELEQERSKRDTELALRDTVSRLMPLVENELAMMLMNDRVQDWNVQQLAELAQFPLQMGYALVVAVAAPDTDEAGEGGSRRLRLEKVYNAVRYELAGRLSCIVSPIIGEQMTVFVRLKDGTQYANEDILTMGEELVALLRQAAEAAVHIGIGRLKLGIDKLRESYVEAACAAAYARNAASAAVVHFEQVPVRAGSYSRPAQLHAVRSGTDTEEALHAAIHQVQASRDREAHAVIEEARAIIHERFHLPLAMEEVAGMVHLSPYYFSKLFKQQAGATFTDYITKLRITRACQYIEQDKLSLKEICYQVGYRDPNYFSRVFKKVTGVAPTEYRSRHSGD
ncbi:AraC family transcriptional regulator [Paenibacillus dendritiformis]|uniref:AraC family transcriptional regulator n=1 Tax=Paenibacillus dendritiformis TaxID=130049 RepID=UPI0010597084|nr:AraC family transcriptional regulator [Paenibacillus dendritiformis]TDL57939.1 AraC family transcriptional regulator [Paenibacillus dendritiformis]